MIDSAKISAQQIALLDAQLRARESAEKDFEALGRASLANRMAQLDQEKAFGASTDMAIAQARQDALVSMDKQTQESIERQLKYYGQYAAAKKYLFTSDEKGQADLLKFEEEASAKKFALLNQLRVAQIDADTQRIQSGLQVKTFWIQQLQDIAASNAFSTGQIITSWTGGVANSIVEGGDFVKQAWKSTEIAVIQGALNMAVQWGAKQALMVAQSEAAAGITTATWAGGLYDDGGLDGVNGHGGWRIYYGRLGGDCRSLGGYDLWDSVCGCHSGWDCAYCGGVGGHREPRLQRRWHRKLWCGNSRDAPWSGSHYSA
jgi:hypothetical protein